MTKDNAQTFYKWVTKLKILTQKKMPIAYSMWTFIKEISPEFHRTRTYIYYTQLWNILACNELINEKEKDERLNVDSKTSLRTWKSFYQ